MAADLSVIKQQLEVSYNLYQAAIGAFRDLSLDGFNVCSKRRWDGVGAS